MSWRAFAEAFDPAVMLCVGNATVHDTARHASLSEDFHERAREWAVDSAMEYVTLPFGDAPLSAASHAGNISRLILSSLALSLSPLSLPLSLSLCLSPSLISLCTLVMLVQCYLS